jgi:hypothetical protein
MKPHYFHVYLWNTLEDMHKNVEDPTPDTMAYTSYGLKIVEFIPKGITTIEKETVHPKLGEIHFVKGKWDLEIVAHELCHMLLNRLELLEPSIDKVFNQKNGVDENICYEHGQMLASLYESLLAIDEPWKDKYKELKEPRNESSTRKP